MSPLGRPLEVTRSATVAQPLGKYLDLMAGIPTAITHIVWGPRSARGLNLRLTVALQDDLRWLSDDLANLVVESSRP